MEKINRNYDRKYFFGYHDALKIYGAPKLCTETTLSNPPVVHPKSSCDVHLLRSLWVTLEIGDWHNFEGCLTYLALAFPKPETSILIDARTDEISVMYLSLYLTSTFFSA